MEKGHKAKMSQKILGQKICPLHDEPMRMRKIGGRIEFYCPKCEQLKREIKRKARAEAKHKAAEKQGRLL
jgi:hypothetical protein